MQSAHSFPYSDSSEFQTGINQYAQAKIDESKGSALSRKDVIEAMTIMYANIRKFVDDPVDAETTLVNDKKTQSEELKRQMFGFCFAALEADDFKTAKEALDSVQSFDEIDPQLKEKLRNV